MKMIINDCFGGFGVRQEVLDELELNYFSEEELRTAARLIEEIENGKDVSDDCAELRSQKFLTRVQTIILMNMMAQSLLLTF